MKICPFCDGEIKDDAIRCRHCSMLLPKPKVAKQDAPQQKSPPPEISKISEDPPPPPQQSTVDTPKPEEKLVMAETPSEPSSQQRAVSAPLTEETKIISEPPSRPSPRQSTAGAPHKEETQIRAEILYEAFIGEKKRAYYIDKFKAFDEQPQGRKASWNWGAFFGNYLWALYRKMYGWFLVCFGIFAFLTIYSNYLKYYEGGAPKTYSILLYICMVAFSLFFGIMGNSLYYRKARKKIAAAQSSVTDKPALLESLRNKGGVHIWILWVCIAGLILSLFNGAYILGANAQGIAYSYLPLYAAMIIVSIVAIAVLYSHINLEWEIKLEEIAEDYKGYIIASVIAIPIILLSASILLTIYDQNKIKEQAAAEHPEVQASITQPETVPDQPDGPTVEEELARLAKERHYNAIKSAHPDFDNLRESGKIVAWIQKQPGRLQDSMLKTYNEGDANAVIALINQFKKAEKSAQLRKQTPKKSISVTSRTEYADGNSSAIGGGIRGIELKSGNIIHGQVISFDGNVVKIRAQDGKISTYLFMEEVSRFIY